MDDVAALAAASYKLYAQSTLQGGTVLCYVW